MIVLVWLAAACTPPDKLESVTLNDFELYTLDGKPYDVGALKGKAVFINVWATWCRPCVQEMPTIAEAMTRLKGRDILFLFASSEPLEEIIAFRDRKQFPFEYVQLKNLEELSIAAIPATFIFRPTGEQVYGEEGFRDWSTAESLAIITQEPAH